MPQAIAIVDSYCAIIESRHSFHFVCSFFGESSVEVEASVAPGCSIGPPLTVDALLGMSPITLDS